MEKLDEISASLDKNPNIDPSIKAKLFELVIIFNKKLPDVSLEKFNNLAKTVKLGRIGKFESLGASFYDVKNNQIMFSPDKLQNDYDLDNLFMKSIIGMISSNGKYSGFNSSSEMYGLNSAYEEILANYLVGNEEMSDQEEEMVITNLIGDVVGNDVLFDAYFSNNGQIIKESLESFDSKDNVLDMLNHKKDAKLSGSLSNQIFSKTIDSINIMFCKKAIKGNVSSDAIESYLAKSPTGLVKYAYNHQNLLDVHNKLVENLKKIRAYVAKNANTHVALKTM